MLSIPCQSGSNPESIVWFLEDHAFSPLYDLAPTPPPSPLSRQQARPATHRKTKKERELVDGRGGRSQIIWWRESLVLNKSFNTLWSIPWIFEFVAWASYPTPPPPPPPWDAPDNISTLIPSKYLIFSFFCWSALCYSRWIGNWAGILERFMGGKIDSWNWLGTKYGIEAAVSHKMLILSWNLIRSRILPSSPLQRINSMTELILTRNWFCGIDAWHT